jgi:transitional endoplasmic reticulum ATPase
MTNLPLAVIGAAQQDAGRGVARLDPADLAALGVSTGALLTIEAKRRTFVRALPARPDQRRPGHIQIDGATRGNAGAAIGETVQISPGGDGSRAMRVVVAVPQAPVGRQAVSRALTGVPLCAGDRHRLTLTGGREAEVEIIELAPAGPALLDDATEIVLQGRAEASAEPGTSLRYEDLGGLGRVVERIREVVELPLRNRAAFAHLGISPPKGVLLVGPPGTGKTMIARAVAAESRAHFIVVNGPELIDKYYGASEQALRKVFETAQAKAPCIIFIDELDSIAPKREALSGEKQVERRIVAQLLTLMDGLASRGEVMVLAATNLPDSIDPALRRPGRFDREIRIDPPDRIGRAEILAVHTRTMPLGPDVVLDMLAERTHGYVGADLAALCREAAVAALRRAGGLELAASQRDLESLRVETRDFIDALAMITPTALRDVFVEVPNVRWAEVAGVDAVRAQLQQAIEWPLRRPELFARLGVRPPRGVLLHGQPGTGKTLLARALATEAQAGFIAVRGPELLTEWQGASERALRDIFARARTAAPCIVFFDEIDAIAGRRGSGDGSTIERMVAQLLTEMDGISDPKGVAVLAATNRLDRIDPALLRPGRFDLIVDIPAPDAEGRRAMLDLHTAKMPLEDDVDLAELAELSSGMVGADIAGLCRKAALAALGRNPSDTVRVAQADFRHALTTNREHKT